MVSWTLRSLSPAGLLLPILTHIPPCLAGRFPLAWPINRLAFLTEISKAAIVSDLLRPPVGKEGNWIRAARGTLQSTGQCKQKGSPGDAKRDCNTNQKLCSEANRSILCGSFAHAGQRVMPYTQSFPTCGSGLTSRLQVNFR